MIDCDGATATEDCDTKDAPVATVSGEDEQDSPWSPIQLVPGGAYCLKAEKCGTTNRPPMEESFLLGPFSLNMPIEDFMSIISEPDYGRVIRKEMLSDNHSHSALSLVESVYPSHCASGRTFIPCLCRVLHEKYTEANYI